MCVCVCVCVCQKSSKRVSDSKSHANDMHVMLTVRQVRRQLFISDD